MDEIETNLKDIDLNDHAKYIISIFENQTNVGDDENVLSNLIGDSQKSEYARVLLQLYEKNKHRFLDVLQRICDTQGKILLNVLDVEKVGKSQILDTLEHLLKTVADNKLDADSAGFYLGIYLAVVSNFEVSHTSNLSPVLQFITSYHLLGDTEPVANEHLATALLVILKELEINKDSAIKEVNLYLKNLLEQDLSIKQFLNLTKLIELLFPVIPHIISAIYTSENCKKALIHQVNKFTYDYLSIILNRLIAVEILKMISSSCIDDTCRNYNVTHYLSILELGVGLENDTEIHLLSILDLIKLWNFLRLEKESKQKSMYDMPYLFSSLLNYLKVHEIDKSENFIDVCVEGLAYLSLNSKCKEEMRNDSSIIKILLSILQNSKNKYAIPSTSQYGILLILSNLSKLKDTNLTEEKKTVNYLKNMSNPETNNEDENQTIIHSFNKRLLLENNIIDIFSTLKIKNDTDSARLNKSVSQIIHIINSISANQEKFVKQEIVKKGGLNILVDFLIKYSTINKTDMSTGPLNMDDDLIESRLSALRATARCLISVNPSLAFNKYDVKTCIPFLVELLGADISKYEGIQQISPQQKYLLDNITNLDKFESLLALTNISSITDPTLKKLVIQRTFDKYLDNFIIDSDNPDIQRASWELVSNLITEPSMLVKFFNIENLKGENYKRLNLLVKLINSRDEKLQITVTGLLANATSEFEMISQIINKNGIIQNDLVQNISDVIVNESENNELLMRASYILLNLVYASFDLGSLQIYKDNKKLIESLMILLKKQQNKETIENITEVLKVILHG